MTTTFESGYVSTLAAKLNPSDTTMTVATAPTVTKGRLFLKSGSTKEWIKFTGVSGTTLTGLVRGLSKTADPSVSGTGLTWVAGTQVTLVEMHDQMSDKQEGMPAKVYATTTTRDADITSPSNGMQCYVTADGTFYDYVAGAWTARANGTNVNASATVAGKVEIGTQAEVDAGTDTGATGAPTVVIPSTLISYVLNFGGITGEIKGWTTATPPTNWLICNGDAISRTTYAALFAVISTTFGVGDGSTTFNIPDFRGRSPIGSGTGTASGATAHALGTTPTTGAGGEETHLLTGPESGIAAHSHTISVQSGVSGGAFPVAEGAANSTNTTSTAGPTNAASAHNIMGPNTAINFIIRI